MIAGNYKTWKDRSHATKRDIFENIKIRSLGLISGEKRCDDLYNNDDHRYGRLRKEGQIQLAKIVGK